MSQILLLLLILCTLPGLPVHAADLAAGTNHWRLDWAGQSRELIVHVPPGLPAGQPAPLVLALHGGGGHAAYMADDERYGLG
ncbi:MAG: hypothetical protein J0M20_04110, partial [Burkholderiales bacterium]|nr:hypothetical protein [Burkholderiales bacterium]